jgi:hypothetical protein
MSISSTSSRNDYIGNGASSVYPYTYRILDEGDLLVTQQTTAGATLTLTLGADYTVSGVNSDAGGNITLLGGNLDNNDLLTIRRVVDLVQPTDIRNQGDFLPETHEDQFDRLVMADQQQQDEIDRSIRLPEVVPASVFSPALPAAITDTANAGMALIINASADGIGLGVAAVTLDITRIFNTGTFAALKATAAGSPTVQRFGFASDIASLVFYTGDANVGHDGWIVVAGAGTSPVGGLI